MTWNVSTQIYSMPSVLDLPSESPPNYNSEQPLRQNDYMFSQSLGQQETIGGRYNTSAFSNISSESGVLGYYPQQYSSSSHHQHPDYRDNSFMWIGASNVYPSSSYDKRYSEDAYIPPRQLLRRHTNSERIEKANNRKRRAPTIAQRRAANIRERRRMYNLNEAFDCLRQRIPTFAYEKRLSRIETLRLAISYISFMARIVNGEDPNTLSVNTYDPQICPSSALTQAELSQSDAISTLHRCDIDDYDEERDEDEEDDTSGADDDATNDVHDQNMNITDRQIDTDCDTHNRA